MIVVYACFNGTHAGVIAAALHLGWLTPAQLPDWRQLKKLPHFDAPEGRGGLRYLSRDRTGAAIYTAAVGNDGAAARLAVASFLAIMGREQGEVVWLDVSRHVSLSWRVGGFCRRYRHLATPGRWLLCWSLRRDYQTLAGLVEGVRRSMAGGLKKPAPASGLRPRLQVKT
ncbi:DUF3189 family protein [Moorella sp. Hama-1]|uniref:DUF3189 family protein n=1 Tax=Moorella sp. Hama-1 TaxID=2138101 RepID=UPI000D65D654|nr:DUF3189 family protein [Moorella sp. Hama-1]MDN5361369.1 hypothetical protein [Moorella sp. (in: firmicutes)]BCV21485.1 hypothetical protein hamaS1_15540 [Moorella sp. Hama-1]